MAGPTALAPVSAVAGAAPVAATTELLPALPVTPAPAKGGSLRLSVRLGLVVLGLGALLLLLDSLPMTRDYSILDLLLPASWLERLRQLTDFTRG